MAGEFVEETALHRKETLFLYCRDERDGFQSPGKAGFSAGRVEL